ncbi:hypothetical protein LI139_10365, partial [Veillonella atypica]|uniref:hypothetical protein n=1 Tax=Veillonella atypica TaxID=39777 RepID=UPI001D0945D0
ITKIWHLSDARIRKKTHKKISKKYCRMQSSETSLNGVTHCVFGTVPETLKWAFCFFLFFYH